MITRIAFAWLAVVLAVPPTFGRDEPTKDDKPMSAKEQFTTLVKEFNADRSKLIPEINKAKGEEQDKLVEQYYGMGKNYAEKFLKLAADNPTDPVAADALFWVLQNGGAESKKAEAKVVELIPDMKLTDLSRNLPPFTSPAAVYEAIAARAAKMDDDPVLPELLSWVATTRVASPKSAELATAATARLLKEYPDNPAIGRICQVLARSRNPKDAETLKSIVESSKSAAVKAEATYALGQQLAAKLDELTDKPDELEKVASEAEKVLASAVEMFGKAELDTRKSTAENELSAFRTTRVGKEAPEIAGKDLDGNEFKLSDYRGKVVMLDFWGNW